MPSVAHRYISALLVGLAALASVGCVAGAASAQPPEANCETAGTDPLVADAQVNCDASRGWRLSAWIGASGDGIVRVEQAGPNWITVFEGPYCSSGVAAATPDDLIRLGMPEELAARWGYPESVCGQVDEALARTGTQSGQLTLIAVAAIVAGLALTTSYKRRWHGPA